MIVKSLKDTGVVRCKDQAALDLDIFGKKTCYTKEQDLACWIASLFCCGFKNHELLNVKWSCNDEGTIPI